MRALLATLVFLLLAIGVARADSTHHINECPDVVCEATVCPSADEIVDRFVERKVAQTFRICRTKRSGRTVCKRWRLVDASRS